jgi:hypothetical protein
MQRNEKFRLNLEISKTVYDLLRKLQDDSDAPSLTEVIRRSLTLFQLVLDQDKSGGHVVFKNADGTEETLKVL